MSVGDKVRCVNPDHKWLQWGRDYEVSRVFKGGGGTDCLIALKGLEAILWSPERFELRE